MHVSRMKERGVKKITKRDGSEKGPIEPRQGSVSFVLTLWAEPREVTADPEWRWKVRHIQSDEQAYFTHIADVLTYVASQTGLPTPP